MKWVIIDAETQAAEIPDAGCFVKFAEKNVCFAPNVTIHVGAGGAPSLGAACSTRITFTTTRDRSSGTNQWVGNAGDKLDAKLDAKHAAELASGALPLLAEQARPKR